MKHWMKACAWGALAGLINGYFGAGGGMVLVPAFTRSLGLEQRTALATSVAVIAPLCLLSAGVYFAHGELHFGRALPFLIGGLSGGIAGGLFFKRVPPTFLRRAFGLLLIYGGIRSLFAL